MLRGAQCVRTQRRQHQVIWCAHPILGAQFCRQALELGPAPPDAPARSVLAHEQLVHPVARVAVSAAHLHSGAARCQTRRTRQPAQQPLERAQLFRIALDRQALLGPSAQWRQRAVEEADHRLLLESNDDVCDLDRALAAYDAMCGCIWPRVNQPRLVADQKLHNRAWVRERPSGGSVFGSLEQLGNRCQRGTVTHLEDVIGVLAVRLTRRSVGFGHCLLSV
mmetsp:Transcript_41391/g.137159  ORF Transcript_41391/g.137159 Transcript_41391/m.137159 type:complete len:222 (-) Transcript_41391:30-695(-)